jgi:dihydroorotate dehydrogenase
VNLAKTPDREIVGEAAVADYLESYRHLAGVADFVVLNVSCPNTSDGTTFEEFGALDRLLEAFALEREGADRPPPLLVKYSLESTPAELVSLSELGLDRGVDGFVVGNTVRGRPASLESDAETIRRAGRGGLSGAPLLPRVVERLRVLRQALGSGPTLIGVGGLLDAPDAGRMIDAGADLVEIYSGLVYEGPNFPARINRFLAGREGSR